MDDQISLYTEMVTLLCQIRGKIIFYVGQSVRKDTDVNEYERLSNITLRCTLKERNSTFIAVLYFTVTEASSKMSITHAQNESEKLPRLQLSGTLYFC